MSYVLTVFQVYHGDSPTGGCAIEDEYGKSFFGDLDTAKRFETAAEAWEWLGIDPDNLPGEIRVQGDTKDDQYTRSYRLDEGSAYRPTVVVTDTPTSEFWANSRIIERQYHVQEAK